MKLISPGYLVIYSITIFFLFTSIPPDYYTSIIHEKDYMFFDVKTYLYVISFLFSFYIGCVFRNSFLKVNFINFTFIRFRKIKFSIVKFFILFSFISIVICLFSLIIDNHNLISYLLSGNGAQIKNETKINSLFMPFLYFNMASSIFYLSLIFENKIDGFYKRLTYIVMLLLFISMFLLIARYIIIPYLLTIFVTIVGYRIRYKISLYPIIKYMLISVFLILGLFILLQELRGGNGFHGLFGYGPASFNRLSAILNDKLILNTPKLYYINSHFNQGWSLNRILISEHNSVGHAGLQWSFNWLTAYGYIYYSIGWLSILYSFILGFFYQSIWISFKKGYLFSIILYPWLFSAGFLWFTYNILAYGQVIIFILTGCVFSILFGKKIT